MNQMLPIVVIFLALILLTNVLGKRKMQKKFESMQENLVPGDRILTTAGLHATLVSMNESTVDLMIADNVVTTWDRRVIMRKIEDTPVAPDFIDSLDEDSSEDQSISFNDNTQDSSISEVKDDATHDNKVDSDNPDSDNK